MSAAPVLAVEKLTRHYLLARESMFKPPAVVHALNGVDLTLAAGRTLGIVGESGCGKSTLARLVMALDRPTAGRVLIAGSDVGQLSPHALRQARRQFQMVFQDPYGSLDPRHTVGRIVAEPLDLDGGLSASDRRDRVAATLADVGLRPADAEKYPHEFSGGQRQRIAIARALITRPALIVADEPVSALDVSVQAQVLNLLQALQDEHGVAFLFISHDLAVVDYVCDDVAVMYLGRVVEQGPAPAVLYRPAHPYTRALIDAVPRVDSDARTARPVLQGGVGSSLAMAPGCAFADRCPIAAARCRTEAPALVSADDGRMVACHFPQQGG